MSALVTGLVADQPNRPVPGSNSGSVGLGDDAAAAQDDHRLNIIFSGGCSGSHHKEHAATAGDRLDLPLPASPYCSTSSTETGVFAFASNVML